MRVVSYNSNRHKNDAISLLAARNMDLNLALDLPQYGLIAYENDVVVAMGFLRCIEGNYAMLDSYITDPKVDPRVRDRALNIITSKLIKIAKNNNIDKLLAFSSEENIVTRAQKHGFFLLPHKFLILSHR